MIATPSVPIYLATLFGAVMLLAIGVCLCCAREPREQRGKRKNREKQKNNHGVDWLR